MKKYFGSTCLAARFVRRLCVSGIARLLPGSGKISPMTGIIGRIAIAFLMIGLLGSVAMGQTTRDWVLPVADDWYDPLNWGPPGVPAPADELIVRHGNPSTPFEVSVDGDAATGIARIWVDGMGTASFGSELYVGYDGKGLLDVSGIPGPGVNLTSTDAFLGYQTGSNGYATVSSGTWHNTGTLVVGDSGAGTLTIADGGRVETVIGRIGHADSLADNTVTVSTGGMWQSSSDLDVGYEGRGSLSITSGGLVMNVDAHIGHSATSSGNIATVDGGGTWDSSGDLYVGYAGSGALNVNSDGMVNSTDGYIGYGNTSIGSTVTVDSSGAWDNGNDLFVGYAGSGMLSIADGGLVTNRHGFIGHENTSSGNVVAVNGTDSTWDSSGDLYVGFRGSGTLSITGGGRVESGTNLIGHESTSIGNVVTVDGSDTAGTASTWDNNGQLFVGFKGSGTLNITGGGLVTTSDNPAIGAYASSTGNVVTVNGTASAWINYAGILSVGILGSGTLNISDGGIVVSPAIHIGEGGDSTGSVVTVGSGGRLDTDDIRVGNYGSGALNITGGGLVTNEGVVNIGYRGSGSTVTVDGGGSMLDSGGEFYVGHFGSGALNITGGGRVENTDGYIGYEGTSIGNVVTVSGTGSTGTASTWVNSGEFHVGREGRGTLNITGGGRVENTDGYIGYRGISMDNVVTVDGTDAAGTASTWANSGEFYVGHEGRGTLNITDGGRVESNGGVMIGFESTSIGNIVTVDGGTWDGGLLLCVGLRGRGALTISNGGRVENATAWIGHEDSSTGNTVTVNSDGTWVSSGYLVVGNAGSGTLSITDGGRVESRAGGIGIESTSRGNIVTVGSGGTWWNRDTLVVGGDGVGGAGEGTLNIQSGGEVRVGEELSIGSDGVVNVFGGTIRFAREAPMAAGSEDMNFLFGTLAFECDMMVTGFGLIGEIFGGSPTISVLNGLEISGAAMLLTPVMLDGGTLSVGSLVNAPFLQFNSGAFNLTDADLSISLGGLFGRTLEVTSVQSISVTNDATVGPTGLLLISGGTFSASTTTNQGEIHLASTPSGSPGLLAGGVVNNEGFLSGEGRISAELHNAATGHVLVAAGEQLMLTGSDNVNHGTIVNSGGTLQTTGLLSNESGGNISSDGHATLRLTGGLDNSGTVAFSDADAYLYGDAINNVGALVGLADASTARFVGAFTNGGDVYVGADSRAVFFGPVSGAGDFPGGGTIEFVDGFSPGGSPAAVSFGGDVVFADGALLAMELGGTVVGDEYDQLDVAGDLTPGGTLQVVLIDDFAPGVGDMFDILEWGTLSAAPFDAVVLPELAGRKAWDTSDLYSTGAISVIEMRDGDADGDGDVDSVDLANLVSVFGGAGDRYTDFNEDGRVDLIDFAIMRANFGAGVNPGAPGDATAATPEPATLILLAGGLPLLLRLRRRRD